jgi:hypothetical protein
MRIGDRELDLKSEDLTPGLQARTRGRVPVLRDRTRPLGVVSPQLHSSCPLQWVVPSVGHPQQGRQGQQLGKEEVILFRIRENQDSFIIIVVVVVVEKRKPSTGRGAFSAFIFQV